MGRERKCAITLLIRSARREISILRFDVGLTRYSRNYESLTLTKCPLDTNRSSSKQVNK